MKTAHIISHSHWDREWYLPYESHHMRLIMLIDQLLEAIDNDKNFKSFHLDGQTICIDDYLQVKPQNREKLLKAIKDGKIKIGPWYILQDAFLTSAEANVRNGYYGNIDCQRYGNKTSVGYYPDTFGIYSQAAQILNELEIDNMIFGRGVSTTGFNNEVSNDFESKFSEMNIVGGHHNNVLGILFANWYSNGNEIPIDKNEAKKYWEQKLAEVERYTGSNHLLFMNGCDHTPYQMNVTQAIEVANELYPEINFKQSSFDEYLSALKAEKQSQELTTISGELTSQSTNGYYTLVNTASSRINQKIANAKIQAKYEFLVEPLSALYNGNYQHAEIEYGWKKLLQNHPHDSICGCSIDSVHKTIDGRFEDSNNVAEHIINETLSELKEQIKTTEDLAFVLVNPSEISNTRHQIKFEYAREEFGSDFRKACNNMKGIHVPKLELYDSLGNKIPCTITDLGIGFDYYLPDDKFRRPYYSRNLMVEFGYKFDFIGHETFYLKSQTKDLNQQNIQSSETIMQNDYLIVDINEDCSINITDKATGITQKNLMKIFDQGDVGNEYMFGAVKDDIPIAIDKYTCINSINQEQIQKRIISTTLTIPKSAEDIIEQEQLEISPYYNRKAKRASEFLIIPVKIELSLNQFDHGVKLKIILNNKAKNHRLRARFYLDDCFDTHESDSAFEIVTRPNYPLESWENPSNDQRLLKFVRLNNEQMALTIATNGLHEYEVKDNYLDLTILRCTGELGDWGHFPTPDAQCIELIEAEVYLTFANKSENNVHANIARSIFVKQPVVQLPRSNKANDEHKKMLDLKHDNNSYISAIKRNLADELIIRLASNGQISNYQTTKKVVKTNMLEQVDYELVRKQLGANEIQTLKIIEE